MGTLLFLLLVILVLAVLVGAGGYSVRRYWSPTGSEVVETGDIGASAGAGVAAAVLALMGLILLFFGFMRLDWFGSRPVAPVTTNNPSVASPATQQSASPRAQPSPSTQPSPSMQPSPSK